MGPPSESGVRVIVAFIRVAERNTFTLHSRFYQKNTKPRKKNCSRLELSHWNISGKTAGKTSTSSIPMGTKANSCLATGLVDLNFGRSIALSPPSIDSM